MKRRISLAETLGIVAVFAAGFAAMRDGSPLVYGAVYSLTLLALLITLLAAWVGPTPRPGCRGFAVFGWAYFLLAFVPAIQSTIGKDLGTAGVFQGIGFRFHRAPDVPSSLASQLTGGVSAYEVALMRSMQTPRDPAIDSYLQGYSAYITRATNSERIGNLLLCWLFGLAGLVLGRVIASRGQPEDPVVH
ncbi:MAG TPA: hypothetical protein VGZ22_15415 [Isosphaeraceae bacterium]|jgi:hypothetical protein|nr:hypothetical protein [Isosphaeraceae bacterium]